MQSTIIKDNSIKIDGFDKIRFSSDIDLPLGKLIEFKVLNLNVLLKKMINIIQKNVCTARSNIYKMNNNSDSNIRELKIDSTLWAAPAKIINLLDFKPEKLSIKTENNANNDIKVHQVRYENGGFYLTIDNIKRYFSFSDNIVVLSMLFSNVDQKNKYHQVWKGSFKIVLSAVNDENGKLKIHEKIRLFDSDMLADKIIKIPSITIVIKSLIEKDNKFYLELH